ncbi:WD repeat-containing protein 74 [Amyelois transitella]|uniref:WD repeat-containing protein 74 n=1 Tax=Amyelois transitella TaxID=680683 RepID=UPI0029901C63|nr:WD repeat-containing protein 74 [Amyelois transitella]
MLLTEDKEVDIFVASKIGSFKHVKYHTDSSKNNKKCIENLVDIKSLQKDDSITCMEWGNADQTEILLGRANQEIQIYNTEGRTVTKTYTADFGTGHLVGLGRCKRKVIAALSAGVVKIWSRKEECTIETGKLDRMRVCADDPTMFATGGEENDLKVYRIGDETPIFSAKNLSHDWLQLRRPVWVTDLAFVPGEGGNLVAACSRHGYVRLYDSRAQRRPVINVDFEMAATCITPSFDERQVLVGFGRGQLHLVDLRRGKPDKGYKGATGAVTDVAVFPRERLVVSSSLDRHLRVHQFDTKELVCKHYLTSKLARVLAQTERNTPLLRTPDEAAKTEELDEMDQLFDDMEAVGETPIESDPIPTKKVKSNPKEDSDEAIRNLLRKTEKTKKKREQRKKEKKAKSVFHNA